MIPLRIAVVHPNDGSDVRVSKICNSLSRTGHDVHFIGWDRRPGTPKVIDLGRAECHVMTRRTRQGRSSVRGQLSFVRHLLTSLHRLRPDVVHCVNEDYGVVLAPFRGPCYRRLVVDVFDSLADRHSHRSWAVSRALRAVTAHTRWRADRLIVTDATRFARMGKHRSKTLIVENVPEDPGAELSREFPKGPIKIYVAGALHRGRGLEQIIAAVEKAHDIEIVSAGWPYDDYASEVLRMHPRVTFHDAVGARTSLELAAHCDAVFMFYEPSSTNNILASPNKLHDASSVGRPVIVNREIRVSARVRDEGTGWVCGFDDAEGLADIMTAVREARESIVERAAKLRRGFEQGPSWSLMESRLARLYEELAPQCSGGAD